MRNSQLDIVDEADIEPVQCLRMLTCVNAREFCMCTHALSMPHILSLTLFDVLTHVLLAPLILMLLPTTSILKLPRTSESYEPALWHECFLLCIQSNPQAHYIVQIANNSEFGLAGAVISADPERCRRVAERFETGIVWINCSQPCFVQASSSSLSMLPILCRRLGVKACLAAL